MRYIIYVLFAFVMASCVTEKEIPKPQAIPEEENIIEFRFHSNDTKASENGIVSHSLDGVSRLDVYIYSNHQVGDDQNPLEEHKVFNVLPGENFSFTLKDKSSEMKGVLVYANLHPDTAEYLSKCKLSDFVRGSSDNRRIYFTADNLGIEHIPMVGSTFVRFGQDSVVDIKLTRMACRIDVGKVAINFIDEAIRGKSVYLRNIVIANACNTSGNRGGLSITDFNKDSFCFGEKTDLKDAFGGITRGYSGIYTQSPYNSTLNPMGSGLLSGEMPRLYNCNIRAAVGVLVADAPRDLGKATIKSYNKDAGEGEIVKAGDMSALHTFTVNHSFYTNYLGRQNISNLPLYSDFYAQNEEMKLIIELEIDGQTFFYPILLRSLQPNTIYKIDTITIKKIGSRYSNFYEKKYDLDFTVSVSEWTNISIPNIDAGVKDSWTGEPY